MLNLKNATIIKLVSKNGDGGTLTYAVIYIHNILVQYILYGLIMGNQVMVKYGLKIQYFMIIKILLQWFNVHIVILQLLKIQYLTIIWLIQHVGTVKPLIMQF